MRKVRTHSFHRSKLFSDKNSIDIYQGPWFRLNNGRMKRDLTYEVENKDFLRMLAYRSTPYRLILISTQKAAQRGLLWLTTKP